MLLFDNAVALEVDIPEGATTFSLSYGPANAPNGFSTSIQQPSSMPAPNQLRVVVLLADPSVVDPCAADEAEATVIAVPHGGQGTYSHHRQKVCVPHPAKFGITGMSRRVFEGTTPSLDEWTPLVFQTWLVRTGNDGPDTIDSAVDLQRNFIVQLGFTTGGSAIRLANPLSLDELADLPAIAELIAEYGLFESR